MKDRLAQKIAEEIVRIQKTWIQIVKERRGGKFRLSHWYPLLQAKSSIFPLNNQSKEIIDLYVTSANAAYNVLDSLTDYVFPEDEPWLEHYQTAAVFEILYEFDKEFKKASHEVAEAIEKSGSLIREEILATNSGRYGPTWVSDYVATPGSLSNLYKRILDKVKIKKQYKWTFINAVSAARNTSYSVMLGSRFFDVYRKTNDDGVATSAEQERMKDMWLNPIETQIEVMKEVGQRSFDYEKCIKMFKDKIYNATVKAAESGAHYANLSLIPFWSAGDFHHISQTTYNLCKSDIEMAILESLTTAFENTIKKAQKSGKLEDPHVIPTWEVMAAGAAYIMRLDGFTSEMVRDLLVKRYRNLILENPKIFQYECMNDEFVNLLSRGEYYLQKPPLGLGCEVNGFKIDLSAIDKNRVLRNPQRYSWPECPITTRFSGLLRFADEPFHLLSDPMICLYATELIALNPKKPYLPSLYCKQCPTAKILPSRCKYCLAEKTIE